MDSSKLRTLYESIRSVVMNEFTVKRDGTPDWNPDRSNKDKFDRLAQKHGYRLKTPESEDNHFYMHDHNDKYIVGKNDGSWEHGELDSNWDEHNKTNGTSPDELDKHLTDFHK